MKIFYAGCEFDHFNPKRGVSFEHENFYLSLKNFPGAEMTYFPFERIKEIGRRKFNEEMLEAARREKPDLFFFFPYSDELETATLEQLKKYTTTLAWFADDSWRFYNYSKFLAKHFTWAVTTYSYMPPLYARAGQPNSIRSQWGVDTKVYQPAGEYGTGPDVSFVGGWTRPRAQVISYLASRGILVSAYGGGWKGGRISSEERNRIFSTSKINLALNAPPGFWNVNSLGRLVARPALDAVVPDFHWIANFQSWLHRGVPQIKARHFEIPACAGFMMTGHADDLEHFYAPGKEIVIYDNLSDMAEKIKHYLTDGTERAAMAKAAYERTLREHTYQKRFEEIFKKIYG